MTAILPCPFRTCGSTEVRVIDDVNVKMFAVGCDACGSRGPFAPTEDLAVSEWNSAYRWSEVVRHNGEPF